MLYEICKPKPYYENDNVTLYKGDCLEILQKLPESADMIFCDPPYFLGMAPWDKRRSFERSYKFHYKWLEACRKVMKPDGTIWVCGLGGSLFECGHAMLSLGYKILNTITWYKPNMGRRRTDSFFGICHETLIWASKSENSRYLFNKNLMDNWKGNYGKKVVCQSCGKSQYHPLIHDVGRQMGTVWAVSKTREKDKSLGHHPTQKPTALLSRIIHSCTKKDDLIVDPFNGSGTTAVVANKFGRQYIGIDKEKKYLHLTIRRLETQNER